MPKRAKAALQGYRLQALCTLATLLWPGAENLEFHLGGNEDLDVYRGDRLAEVIQVQAHAENLAMSSFAPDQRDAFFQRAAAVANFPPTHFAGSGVSGPLQIGRCAVTLNWFFRPHHRDLHGPWRQQSPP